MWHDSCSSLSLSFTSCSTAVIVVLLGTIPESLGELKDLIVLNLAGNALEGSIPSTLGSAASLVSVNLGDNKLEGAVPMALGQGKHLKYVRLNGNALEQFDDAWFTPGALKSSELVIFDAANNELKVSCVATILYSMQINKNQQS